MATKSSIQWTDATWNVAVGCTKVDADCKYCYMYRQSLNDTRYKPDQVVKTKTVFNFPLKYKQTYSECRPGSRPLIFTSSLTDFFHEDIDSFRDEAWDIIRKSPHLIFQILTKRPERITACLPKDWGDGWDNVWLGTSVGSNAGIQRMVDLSIVTAKTLFLSLEPLHDKIDFSKAILSVRGMDFNVIPAFDWIIVGGESGNDHGKYKYRPCELTWIEDIVKMAKANWIPVFVKQLGTHLAKEMGMKDRHGGDFDEFPESIKFREFPV